MKENAKKIRGTVLFGVVLVLATITFYGCKKTEPVEPVEQTAVTQTSDANAATEQKLCPVLGNPIDENVYVVYKGKKVYFCCAGCKPQFEKDPEKYISKLPQFAK